MAYTKYSLTPANNTAAPPDGAPEGMLPSAVNDTMRDMMAQIRDVGDGIRDGTYTMTAPKITGGTITGITFTSIVVTGGSITGTTVTSNTFSSSGATITGGTINSTAIGGTTAAAGKFTTLEATDVTTVQAGTVSLPAITTTGDTNTGIYFPAADTIGLTVGGVESARVVSGLLSIPANSTAPSAVRLYEDTDNGTNYVDFIAPSAITSNRTLTIPDETGTIITTASSGQSIPKAALPTGSVLQVVSAVMTGGIFSTTSTSFVDVGFTATITPTSATSRILILFNSGGITRPAVASECLRLKIVRGASTDVYGGDNLIFSTSATQFQDFPSSYQCVDSPATTSSTTYKIQMETRLGNSCSMNSGATNNPATLQLLEIAS